jgi:isopenicillin-N N-acyltransferase-like protein
MLKLTVSGTPRARGLAHGEQFRSQIHALSEIRRGLLQKYLKRKTMLEIDELAFEQARVLAGYPDFYAEFTAIAESAHLSLVDLVILNNYTDMRDFGGEGGCSVVALRNSRETLAGQTWDMHASATPHMLHLSTPEAEILTVVGCLGLAGVGRKGVGVLINNLHSHEFQVGLIWPALVRGMLLESSARAARTYMEKNLPCSGHNYLLVDAEEALNVEATGKRIATTAELKAPGVTFHTNHYVDPALAKTEILSLQSKTTHARHLALEKYFAATPVESLDSQKLCEDVFAGAKAPAVCVHPPAGDPHGAMTCGGMLLDFRKRTGLSFGGLYQSGDHHRFSW